MKRFSCILGILLMAVPCSAEYPKVGVEFEIGSDNRLSALIHVSPRWASSVFAGLDVEKEYRYGSSDLYRDHYRNWDVSLGLEPRFYIVFDRPLCHFLAAPVSYAFEALQPTEESEEEVFYDDLELRWAALYGLQYNFNEHIAVHGKLGIGFYSPIYMRLERVYWETVRSAAGLVIHL